MSGNLLVRCMPDDVGEDLMGAGAPFRILAGEQIDRDLLCGSHVFIVTEGIGSKFLINSDGRSSEVGMVGYEGMFPVAGLLNVPGTQHLVLAQVGPLVGRVLRAKDFHAIIQQSSEASRLVNLFVYSFLTQIATNLMTTDQNLVVSRLARWLLMCHDRTDGDTVLITHDMLADMISSHRPTVTRTLALMREAGLIELERAKVHIRSRDGLARLTEGFYGTATSYYNAHICAFGKGGT